MHELAVCRALVAQVDAIARGRAARVHAVHVGIGPLAGVDTNLMAHAYASATAGTAAQGSLLSIEAKPLRVRCRSCGHEGAALPNDLTCTACGDWRTQLLSGDELLLLSVELEVDESAEVIDV
jgi:hydrogenase nickel incorporation protein HypA/HybF